MRNTNKKGFTIVELVIVVAVIAILAAVLIPTFSGIIAKANLSADQQAVRHMNTALAAEEAFTNPSIFSLFATLDELGMSAKDYKPLTKDTMFFWDAKLNCILHVDANMKVLAPAEHTDKTYDPANDTWISLSMELFETKEPQIADGYTDYKVSGYNGANVNVKITSKEELAFVFNYLNEEIAKNTNVLPASYTIDLGGNVIDMMGASLCIENLTDGGSGLSKSFSIKNGTIKNVSLVDPTSLGNGQTEGHTGQYKAGFIAKISGNTSVTIENVTFEGIHVNNSHVSQAGLLIGYAGGKGTVSINNVTIKNSSLLAHRSAGALIGNVPKCNVKVKLNNITLTNVDVKTVGGRSAMLIGYFQQPINAENSIHNFDASGIKLTNCSFSLYECAQNTGTSPVDNTTVLSCPKNGGTVKSWAFKSDGVSKENTEYSYVLNALMLLQDQVDGSSHFDGAVTGWK